ncbi:MAG: DUF805 domain-containing protein [Bacteroidota bacterium]
MEWYLKVLKKYAIFEGRARRKEYWYFVLFNIIFSFGIGFVDVMFGTYSLEAGTGLFGAVYIVGVIVPAIAVGVRRMHDVGKSGWYLLIPIYNLILAVTEGDVGENEYGRDPKDDNMELYDHLVD